MSFQEKKAILMMVSGLIISAIYSAIVFQQYNANHLPPGEDIQFWAKAILFMIPISIFIRIFLMILLAITHKVLSGEDAPDRADERDKLIQLKALQFSYFIFILGFILAMGVLALGMPPSLMFALIVFSGVLSEIVSESTTIYYYRRGF